MHEKAVVGVGQLLRLVVRDLGQDDGRERGRGGRGRARGGVLGEDGGAVSDAGAGVVSFIRPSIIPWG